MQEESDVKCDGGIEPCMNRHKPASDNTQDVSHLLASMFKDLYTTEVIGKDTVASLTKSCRGGNDHHAKYVEELQQVHSEYKRRIENANMLERHIIQARMKASAADERAQAHILEEFGESYHQLGLPPVKSAFMWCVDNGLLRSHNLICPQVYRPEQIPLTKAPQGKSMPGFAQPTVSYNQHISTELKDDGYTLISQPELTVQSLLEESEGTLTLSSSNDTFSVRSASSQKGCQVRKPLCTEKLNPEDRAALEKFKGRQNFLRNPHFQSLSHQRGGKSLIISEEKVERAKKDRKESTSPDAPMPVFIANPPVVLFTEYQIGHVYESTVELRNVTAASRHVRVIPPNTPHFSVGLGRFPGEGGIVAPGMSCQYTVRFAPESLADYEDFLVVETQSSYPLIIPVEAHRPPPVLTLPAVLDFGYCLVGGVKFMDVVCRNDGLSAGMFCIMPKRQWPASSLRSVVKTSFAEEHPFAISPSLFSLLPGQSLIIEVVFFPTAAEIYNQSFTIICDNCQVKDFTIQGKGQLVMLELVALEDGENLPVLGEVRDLTADHFVRFEPTNPHSIQHRKMVIKNNTHLELPFHWQIVKPNLQCLPPEETPDPSCIHHHVDTDDTFTVSPAVGLLAPTQEHVFLLTYHPQELKDYHSVCHLVIRDVPDLQKMTESCQQDLLPQVGDVIVMEIEVKGTTEPYKILLEPYALFIPGETYIHTTIRKSFRMWNHSRSAVRFQWERINDIIEVEPSSGEIETNECFDVDLMLTGSQPGHLTTTLQCHVQHRSHPVGLAIDATFKGPNLSVNVPSLDLGLLELGQEVCSSLQIINSSPLEACWILKELPSDPAINQVRVEPSQGVLPPGASCSVKVIFRAVSCQSFESVLQLTVPNGTGCLLPVRAEVQSPQVCLLSCRMELDDLYVGVAQTGKTVLLNQTLLPAHFTWRKEELTEVAAVCQVEGVEKPLVLGFHCKAKSLSVSYSLPQNNTERATVDDVNEQPTILDFTEYEPVLIGISTIRQLLITNHTAIPAPFTMEVKVFTGHRLLQSSRKTQSRGDYVRTPVHEMQAKKMKEKEYEDFVRGLLAHGKGAAFFVEPQNGTLGPFETATITITAFNNMWGDYQDHLICMVGDLDPELILMRLSVRGCPVYFQMTGPQPDNQNQGPVIRFGTHVSGGDTVSRSLRLNNTSPCDIRMDWLTYNKESEDSKLIDLMVAYGDPFPLKDTDGNEIVGGLDRTAFSSTWDQSQTPSSDGSSSSLTTKSDCDEEQFDDEEERGSQVPLSPARKLCTVFIQPHEGHTSDYPYCITPQQIVIPAGGFSTISVSFTPLTLSDPASSYSCVGYALGYMSLDSKVPTDLQGNVWRAQGYELEPLRLDLLAHVKPATLTVQLDEDEDILEFQTNASDLIDNHTLKQESLTVRTLQLINNTDVPLSFTLNTQQPFSVLQDTRKIASSESPSHVASRPRPVKSKNTLLLQPKRNLQVKVAFHLSASLLTCQNQPGEESPPSTILICSEKGERRLRFEQSLSIQYSNGSVQTVPLCAHLALSTLQLSCNTLDFGTCYVGQTRVQEVHLSNCGGSSSFWTAIIDAEEDSNVFGVTPECGLLKPAEYPVYSCKQTLEISFTPRDQRSFHAMITIQGILGEPCLTVRLQGTGSLDERYSTQ
ncbi:deleted in lung and esophageal cancer protein 1 isoform X2 [Trichomycterus rosablanca]|uniref:deleted in lung and esophageal cancer protein 1 isoform X2 n=1 Tax=Trichomycterus rosablanca TaxID=2290929 RepID=UPI002F36119D